MTNDAEFLTATMAGIFTDQGHFEKAIDIYRHLLTVEPDREDYLQALSELEEKVRNRPRKKLTDLIPLFEKWIDLSFKYNNVQKLKKMRRRL
jgi:tetratricopeptide (TPR) repeat protein